MSLRHDFYEGGMLPTGRLRYGFIEDWPLGLQKLERYVLARAFGRVFYAAWPTRLHRERWGIRFYVRGHVMVDA